MSFQQFYDTLLSIKSDKKTGKIYLYVRENGSRRTGEIVVGLGEILSVNYSQKTDKIALGKLLSSEVENVIFMPRSDVESNKIEPDTPAISDVLLQLLDKLDSKKTPEEQSNIIKSIDLLQEVRILLEKIYGPGILKEIYKIANVCPPDQNPHGFLDQCKSKAMLMLSKDQVEAMFRPLYGRKIK